MLILSVFLLIYFVTKNDEKKYKRSIDSYSERLNILRDILNERSFSLYTKDKIKKLLKDGDDHLPELTLRNLYLSQLV